MGKGTDKLYITHSEWQTEFGGAAAAGTSRSTSQLPRTITFDLCALSLLPHQHPVSTRDCGAVFELENILPFIERYHCHPVTGKPLQTSDLIRLHFSLNSQGKAQCPVTFKEFTGNSHIVFVATTGNVYSFGAVEKLNIKSKNWKDLLTDEPFKRSDLITIQDPSTVDWRQVSEFHHIKEKLFIPSKTTKKNSNAGGMANRILSELDATQPSPLPATTSTTSQDSNKFPTAAKDKKLSAHYSTGRAAASLTSTSMVPVTVNEAAELDANQLLYKQIKSKGYAQIQTNLGQLNFELFCDKTPQTCHNFILLSKSGYYKSVKFHRSIKNFMIQGGDPDGTGMGGRSYWQKPFADEFHQQLSHDSRGLLCMANKGRNTNGSQFFITFKPCKHLDNKHTVFGRLVGGMDVLDRMEQVPTDGKERPQTDIVINDIQIFVDPYEDWVRQEREREEKTAARRQREEKERLDRLESMKRKSTSDSDRVGRYLKVSNDDDKSEPVKPQQPNKKQQKMSNFDSW